MHSPQEARFRELTLILDLLSLPGNARRDDVKELLEPCEGGLIYEYFEPLLHVEDSALKENITHRASHLHVFQCLVRSEDDVDRRFVMPRINDDRTSFIDRSARIVPSTVGWNEIRESCRNLAARHLLLIQELAEGRAPVDAGADRRPIAVDPNLKSEAEELGIVLDKFSQGLSAPKDHAQSIGNNLNQGLTDGQAWMHSAVKWPRRQPSTSCRAEPHRLSESNILRTHANLLLDELPEGTYLEDAKNVKNVTQFMRKCIRNVSAYVSCRAIVEAYCSTTGKRVKATYAFKELDNSFLKRTIGGVKMVFIPLSLKDPAPSATV